MNEINPSVPPPPSVESPQAKERIEWLEHVRTGSSWLWAIALLSVINSLISFFGGSINFLVGMGISQFIDALGYFIAEDLPDMALIIRIVALFISLLPAVVMGAFGFFARRGKTWAFIVPAVAYALDMLLVLFVEDWFGGLFHLVGLFYIVRGGMAASKLHKTGSGL